jgi:hypothetical protein
MSLKNNSYNANLPHRNPVIPVRRRKRTEARNLPAESKAAPNVHPAVVAKANVHPAVVAKAGPTGQNPIQGALTAPRQMQTHKATVKPVHPARNTALGHGNAMQVALTCHHRNIGGTDVHAVPHPIQRCHHIDADIAAIGTAPYHLPQPPHTHHLRVRQLHLIVDDTTTAVSAAADAADIAALVQQVLHPSHVPLLYQDACKTG